MKPVRFCLHVTAAPHQAGGWSALRFARAAIASGHSVRRVFFSGAAASIANRFATVPGDEPDLRAAWLHFAGENECELHVCSSAAERQGVLDSDGVQRVLQHVDESAHAPSAPVVAWPGALAEGFLISGLGTLMESLLEHDRIMHFPD